MRILLFSLLAIAVGCNSVSKPHDQSGPALDQAPTLEKIFSDSTFQLTGIAVSQGGRLFTSYPLWSGPHRYSLVEIFPGNKVKPYPDEAMNSWKAGDSGMNKWVCVQAVYIDDSNTMWVVDPASPMQKGVYQNSQKLVQINLTTNKVDHVFPLSAVTDNQSYINDVRIDTRARYAYLTNSGEGGIVVIDLNTGRSRQLLQGDSSVLADKSYNFKIEGREVRKNGSVFKGNSDGIALTPDGVYLYYKPPTDGKLYRIKTAFLKDTTLMPAQLSEKVEKCGRFTTTDGMEFDKKGNLYLGDLESHRIVRISPDMKMQTIIRDSRLIWPDSYQAPGDGFLYISCSQINKQPEFNNGKNMRVTPYSIYTLKLP